MDVPWQTDLTVSQLNTDMSPGTSRVTACSTIWLTHAVNETKRTPPYVGGLGFVWGYGHGRSYPPTIPGFPSDSSIWMFCRHKKHNAILTSYVFTMVRALAESGCTSLVFHPPQQLVILFRLAVARFSTGAYISTSRYCSGRIWSYRVDQRLSGVSSTHSCSLRSGDALQIGLCQVLNIGLHLNFEVLQ